MFLFTTTSRPRWSLAAAYPLLVSAAANFEGTDGMTDAAQPAPGLDCIRYTVIF